MVRSELKDGAGGDTDISADWVVGPGDTATYTNALLSNGWYGIVYRLYDNGAPDPSGGWAELARIVKDQTTTGVIDFTVTAVFGGLEIQIDTDFFEDLPLTPDVAEGDVNVYPDMSTLITVTPGEAALSFWYVNGEQVSTAGSFDVVGNDYITGKQYNLDLLAFSIAGGGKKAGSLHWQIVKDTGTPAQKSLSGSFITEVTWEGEPYTAQAQDPTTGAVLFEDAGTIQAGALTSFDITGIDDGDYKLFVETDLTAIGQGIKSEYWANTDIFGSATVVTVPQPLPVTDFAMGEL